MLWRRRLLPSIHFNVAPMFINFTYDNDSSQIDSLAIGGIGLGTDSKRKTVMEGCSLEGEVFQMKMMMEMDVMMMMISPSACGTAN
jgi:hypothetical protein